MLFVIVDELPEKTASPVVPVASERGLPLGVHIAAGHFRDHVALAAASAVEEAIGGYAAVSWPLLPHPS